MEGRLAFLETVRMGRGFWVGEPFMAARYGGNHLKNDVPTRGQSGDVSRVKREIDPLFGFDPKPIEHSFGGFFFCEFG